MAARRPGAASRELVGAEAIKRSQGQDRACELDLALPSGAKALANPVFRGNRLVGAIVGFLRPRSGRRSSAPEAGKNLDQPFHLRDIVGDSPALANAVRLATRAARTEQSGAGARGIGNRQGNVRACDSRPERAARRSLRGLQLRRAVRGADDFRNVRSRAGGIYRRYRERDQGRHLR